MANKVLMLFVGPLWRGSTALQRCEAFAGLAGQLEVEALDTQERPSRATLMDRIRHRLRLPADHWNVNERLILAVKRVRPAVVFVDSCRLLTKTTLISVRSMEVPRIVFYTPDNAGLAHNSSRQLEGSYQQLDVFFTTKSFLIGPLKSRGLRRVVLAGNAFDPGVHRGMTPAEVGADYEKFDVVLVGTHERERALQILKLASEGISVVVYGNGWEGFRAHPKIELRPAVYGLEYARALHTAKLAICPLRQINGDLITTRSVEVPACARPMLAEKSVEHDEAFRDGSEYIGYASLADLCVKARQLLVDDGVRTALGEAGRRRAIHSGYSTADRARQMLAEILK